MRSISVVRVTPAAILALAIATPAQGTYTTFGRGCPGKFGTPALTGSGNHRVGGSTEVRVVNLTPSTPSVLYMGFSDTHWFQRKILPFDLGALGMKGCTLWSSPDIPVAGASSARGDFAVAYRNPTSSGLIGLAVFHQLLAVDSTLTPPFIVSNAGKATVGPAITLADRAVISTAGSTRATAYWMSNKIVRSGDKSFVCWLDAPAHARIATYTHSTKQWTTSVLLGIGTDNHGGPALTRDSRGTLHVVFGPHHAPFQYRSSTKPDDASVWSTTTTIAGKNTYPSLVCDGADTLHLVYRGGTDQPSNKSQWRLCYRNKPKNGSWSKERILVEAGYAASYTHFGNSLAVDSKGTLHLAFQIYDQPRNNRGHSVGYLRSTDGVRWTNAAGVAIQLPANPTSNCMVEQGSTLDMRVTNCVVDRSGHPWILVAHLENASMLLWHHDGQRWTSINLLPHLQAEQPNSRLAGGSVTFDAAGTLYVTASTIAPNYSIWFGDPSQEVVVMVSRDGGKTWAVTPISTPDPKLPNWLTSIERPYSAAPIGVPGMLFTHGDRTTTTPPTQAHFVQLR